jgi:hypothetical protein
MYSKMCARVFLSQVYDECFMNFEMCMMIMFEKAQPCMICIECVIGNLTDCSVGVSLCGGYPVPFVVD